MELRQEMQLECPMCKKHIDFENVGSSVLDTILFGNIQYSICLHCLQECKKPWSAGYKKRWDAESKKREEQGLHEAFSQWLKDNIITETLTMTDYLLYRSCFFEGGGSMANWIKKEIRK